MERGIFEQFDLCFVQWMFRKYFSPDIIVSFKQCNTFFMHLCNNILHDEKVCGCIISCDGNKTGHRPVGNIPGCVNEYESSITFIHYDSVYDNTTTTYSFDLYPEEYQPSGTSNISDGRSLKIPLIVWCYWCKKMYKPIKKKKKKKKKNNNKL